MSKNHKEGKKIKVEKSEKKEQDAMAKKEKNLEDDQKVKESEALQEPSAESKTSGGRMDIERAKQNLTLLRQKFFTHDH